MLETSSAFQSSSWTNLSNIQCISDFQHQLVSAWAEVIVVVDASANETLLTKSNPIATADPSTGRIGPPYSWMCQDAECSSPPVADSWEVTVTTPLPVQNCYARPAVEHCQVQFIPSLMAVVIICNAVKAICISKSFWRKGWNRSLVTVGGALIPKLTVSIVTQYSALAQWFLTLQTSCRCDRELFGTTRSNDTEFVFT
jgi:hypothetical protein